MLKHFVVVMVALSVLSAPARSQSKPTVTAVQAQHFAAEQEATNNGGAEDPHRRLQQELMNRAFVQRQAELKRDTERLVALTAELKLHVDNANPNILSMDAIKKAAEIQKLAKSVQDRMKNAY